MRPIQIIVRGQTIVPGRSDGAEGPSSGFFREDRLASEMSRYLGCEISFAEDAEIAVSSDAFVLLFDDRPPAWMVALDDEIRDRRMSRLFLLHGQRLPSLLHDLEKHRLAGGIEAPLYMRWRSHPEKTTGYGLAGLRSVADRLGARCSPPPFASERYCVLDQPNAHSMTEALAHYLTALDLALAEG
jgi:hypothetical protein